MERIVDIPTLAFLAIFAVIAFIIRLIFGTVAKNEGGEAFKPALETAAITFLGGFIARMFISIVLASANDSTEISLVAGWGFFFPIGVIDTIIYLIVQHPILTKPDVLLWIAAVVGGFSGMMSGIWRSYDWDGLGVPSFLLDSTWGLSGTFNACLLHLINFAWGDHADDPAHRDRRRNNHRYKSGFRIKGTFAFTQGAVMSNLTRDSADDLWHHENTHVWQNRGFGPLFTLTYVGWMVILFIPSLIVAGITRSNLGDTIMALCYYDNPWEVWAYKIGGWRNPFMAWSDPVVIVASVIFYGAVFVIIGLVLSGIY
ncbi:MAG: hypothetical protein IT319_07140 [Anaerolineae bacterium]|nr:hypothetical protein [Anaerolineae bacterium]